MKNKDGTFQEDIQCIVEPNCNRGGIFISNIQAASNPNTLKKHGIGAVLSAVQGKNLSNIMPKHIEYLYIPAVDHQTFDISVYFDMSFQFLKQQSQKTNVLVHCMAGVSRSVTLVTAFLMRSRSISSAEAIAFIKQRRKIICPNESFLAQLKRLQSKILKDKPSKAVESISSDSSWFSKGKESASTNGSWFSKKESTVEQSGQKVRIGGSGYDVSLKEKIRMLFEAKKGKV